MESALPLPSRRHAAYWIAAILLTLILHALFIFVRVPESWVFWGMPAVAPPVRIHQVDPAKLAQIRKQWRDEKAKQLLLSREPKPAVDAPDNPEARYLSDRNRRVEREQRAKQTAIQPRAPRSAPRSRERPARLSALGVPMPLRNHPPEAEPPDDPGEAGDQYVKDPALPEGDRNLLNTQESVYYSFYARLYDAIAPTWQSRIREALRQPELRLGEYVTLMDVVLDEQGNLVDTIYSQSSGVPEFDRIASDTWRRIGRFPNPPRGLLDEKRQVHIGWSYTVVVNPSAQAPLQFMPPQRTY